MPPPEPRESKSLAPAPWLRELSLPPIPKDFPAAVAVRHVGNVGARRCIVAFHSGLLALLPRAHTVDEGFRVQISRITDHIVVLVCFPSRAGSARPLLAGAHRS